MHENFTYEANSGHFEGELACVLLIVDLNDSARPATRGCGIAGLQRPTTEIDSLVELLSLCDRLLQHTWPLLARRLDIARAALHTEPICHSSYHAVWVMWPFLLRSNSADDDMQIVTCRFGATTLEHMHCHLESFNNVPIRLRLLDLLSRELET